MEINFDICPKSAASASCMFSLRIFYFYTFYLLSTSPIESNLYSTCGFLARSGQISWKAEEKRLRVWTMWLWCWWGCWQNCSVLLLDWPTGLMFLSTGKVSRRGCSVSENSVVLHFFPHFSKFFLIFFVMLLPLSRGWMVMQEDQQLPELSWAWRL